MKLKVISSMDIQAERAALIKRLEQINDKPLLRAIKHLVDFGLRKSEERISIEQYNLKLDEADAEIDRGEFYTQDEAEKMSKKW